MLLSIIMDIAMNDRADTFARAFGDALRQFLDDRGISVTAAAARMGMNKQTLSSYWTDTSEGKRNKARAELLFLACAELDFEFEFQGRTVSARPSSGAKGQKTPPQMARDYAEEFELQDRKGRLSVRLKRPPGRVEVSMSLKAVSEKRRA